ncbi:uncharacterized protein METZ01_LOCUS477979 [marine metagenome]|uniref:C2H2-type domain-containing protein n=1 Tax=marine metagenome TaxID=408172 RepID=A0A383C0M5_9ZZZZ
MYYDEEFFKKYGWVSCYECDKIFFSINKLTEHQKECDSLQKEKWTHN